MVYLPWCFSRSAGQSEFFDLETGRILEPDELVINSVTLLEPWKTTVENRTKPKAKQPSFKPVVGCLDDLKELSTKCTAMNELLSQSETPPSSANGMGNSSRLRLAQISKHIGVPDSEVLKLFIKQPNYKEQACLTNIRSIDISLPPPNCKNIATDLGFCDGKCSAIAKIKAGTPIALLATEKESTPITQPVTTSYHKTYATFITKFDGNDLRLNYDTCEVILSCERGSGEKSQTIETKISNFYFEVKSQRTTMNNGKKQRRLLLAVHGRSKNKDWNTDVEVESDIYSTPRDLLKYIEKHVGPMANTYAPYAAQVLKTLSSELASDVETDLLFHGGVHDQRYIFGNYEISRQEIIQSPVPLTLASEFDKTKAFNFIKISKEEAYNHLKNFVFNSAGAYHRDTWPISITTVALNFAIQSRLSFASDVRCGFEIAGDQGKGKTEYCLTIGSFYAPEIKEETLWHLKETPASLEALAPYFNGAPFLLNDIKNIENPAAVAEQYQNLIDGAAKTKMVEGRPTTSPTFKGLVILNGQEALSAHSSSLASRLISLSIKHGRCEAKFRELQKMRPLLCGISPWLIMALMNQMNQEMLGSYFKEEITIFESKAEEMVKSRRTIRLGALITACARLTFDLLEQSEVLNNTERRKLSRLKIIAVATLQRLIVSQVKTIEAADNLHRLFVATIQGVESGALFIGDAKPLNAASTAICIGRFIDSHTIWINYGALLGYIKRAHGGSEIAALTHNSWTRELNTRKLLVTSKTRLTTRISSNSDWGWKLKFTEVPMLYRFLSASAPHASSTQFAGAIAPNRLNLAYIGELGDLTL